MSTDEPCYQVWYTDHGTAETRKLAYQGRDRIAAEDCYKAEHHQHWWTVWVYRDSNGLFWRNASCRMSERDARVFREMIARIPVAPDYWL